MSILLSRSDTNKLQGGDEQDIGTECAEHYFIDVILSRQVSEKVSSVILSITELWI